jgi:hypothetical protein
MDTNKWRVGDLVRYKNDLKPEKLPAYGIVTSEREGDEFQVFWFDDDGFSYEKYTDQYNCVKNITGSFYV